jgi:hypothetical protein
MSGSALDLAQEAFGGDYRGELFSSTRHPSVYAPADDILDVQLIPPDRVRVPHTGSAVLEKEEIGDGICPFRPGQLNIVDSGSAIALGNHRLLRKCE